MDVVTLLITGVVLFNKPPNLAAPSLRFPTAEAGTISANVTKDSSGKQCRIIEPHVPYVKVLLSDFARASSTLRPAVVVRGAGNKLYGVFILPTPTIGGKPAGDYTLSLVTNPGTGLQYMDTVDNTPNHIRQSFAAALRAKVVRKRATLAPNPLFSILLPRTGSYWSLMSGYSMWQLEHGDVSMPPMAVPQTIVADIKTLNNTVTLSDKSGTNTIVIRRPKGTAIGPIEIGCAPLVDVIGVCPHGDTIPGCEPQDFDYHEQLFESVLGGWKGKDGYYPDWKSLETGEHHAFHPGGANCPPLVFE